MNPEEEKNIQPPDFTGEKMKLPESDLLHNDPEVRERSAFGLVIAILVVLLIAILAGLYYWYSAIINQPIIIQDVGADRPSAEENNEPESTTAEAQAGSFNVVSTSDELSAIEADIESTNLDSLDNEMEAIDAEMEAAMSAQ